MAVQIMNHRKAKTICQCLYNATYYLPATDESGCILIISLIFVNL